MGIESVGVRKDVGTLAEKVTVEWLGLDDPYVINELGTVIVTGRERTFRVESKRRSITPEGWMTTIDGLTREAELATLAPKKTWTFVSMTDGESQEMFDQLTNQGALLEDLDYVLKIRRADAFGVGGWKAHDIIKEIALKGMGLQKVVVNILDFAVKQFSVDPSRSFLSAIVELVKIFEPLVYVFGNTLYVLDSSSMEDFSIGSFKVNSVSDFEESQVRKDGAEQLVLEGDLGEFRPQKYRGFAGNVFAFSIAVKVGSSELGFTVWGGPRQEHTQYSVGGIVVEVNKLIARDVHGSDSFVIWEEHLTEPASPIGLPYFGLPPKEATQEAHVMEFTHWLYAKPREVLTQRVSGAMLPTPQSGFETVIDPVAGDLKQVRKEVFLPEVEKRTVAYRYDKFGRLLSQEEVLDAMMYTEDSEEFQRLDQIKEEDISSSGQISIRRLEANTIQYEQLSRETYASRRTSLRADKNLKFKQESQIQIIQAGGAQQNQLEFRKMRVYAAKGQAILGDKAEENAVLANESVSLRVNTPSWEDIERIFTLVEKRQGRDEVTRTCSIPEAVDLLVGMVVDFSALRHFPDAQLPARQLDGEFIIDGYEIHESSRGKSTRITCRGFLAE